jgi:outer membrane protein OmpA-like peptidoglycan-associated protein
MPKIHALDIYPHTGGRCLGCVEGPEDDEGAGDGAAPAGDAREESPATGAPTAAAGGAAAEAAVPIGLPAPSLLEVAVFDAGGTPEAHFPLDVELDDGTVKPAETGADGVMRLALDRTGTARVRPRGAAAGAGRPGDGESAGAAAGAEGAGGRPVLVAQGVAVPIGVPTEVALPRRAARLRLSGLRFETGKCFLLPAALSACRVLVKYCAAHPGAEVLAVGHADTDGGAAHNLALSGERALAVVAFLGEDVDAWLGWYGSDRPAAKRWGTREDQHMLSALHDGVSPFHGGEVNGALDAATSTAVERFQRWSNATRGTDLAPDGDPGPLTRRALVCAYLALDGTTLPASVPLRTHACGENHPETPTGDGVASADNRRVELFLFHGPVDPPPAATCKAPGCREWAQWKAAVFEELDVRDVPLPGPRPLRLRLQRDGAPLAGTPFRLVVDGAPAIEGQTGADGRLVSALPEGVAEARLVLPAEGVDWVLRLGLLPPVAEIAGVQSRLANLGYLCARSGTLDDATRSALACFQEDQSIGITGKDDPATRERLVQAHGS